MPVYENRNGGFTLVELMVTIAVMAVLVGWAIPSSLNLISRSQISATSNGLVGLVNHARSEALNRGERVWLSPREVDGSASWENGVVSWQDEDGNGALSDNEVIRVTGSASSNISISGSSSSLAPGPFGFDGSGLAIADQSYTLTICSSGAPSAGVRIELNAGGQLRTESYGGCGGGS